MADNIGIINPNGGTVAIGRDVTSDASSGKDGDDLVVDNGDHVHLI